MTNADLLATPIAQLATLVSTGRVAAADVVRASIARASEAQLGRDGLNAVLWSDDDAAVADADALDAARGDGSDVTPRRLAGVPVMVKDNIATVDLPTTCGSRILEGYVSPYEATVVTRLREAGAVVVGKTNMDEFGMGSSTEHSAYGPARNPLDPSRVPGGSSGGSAAAVAAGAVRIALGSETGGSVRQPAAFCGVVGVKPTYGRVSRSGLVAFASSLDQVGVFGRTVDDAALALEVVAGLDPLDATSTDTPVPSYRGGGARVSDGLPLRDVRIGLPKEYFPDTLDARLKERIDHAVELLKIAGARVESVSLPHTSLAIPVYYVLAPAEASSNLARYDGVRFGRRVASDGLRDMYERTRSEGFGAEVTRRILIGTYVLSAGYYDAYYRRAQEVRALIARDFSQVFDTVDLLLTPTTPTPAFRLGAVTDPYEMYLNDVFTVTANLAGVPAMSVPAGRVDGMPVGAQLIAPHFGEALMFRAAYALERAMHAESMR
ncbi:Glutamyl-tRNA(Gln) amidotransferase subunit A [Gemmatirosa kalamazoonensis]|uniref:Glutamyl-tRNA(Gln) amidotransferase subunit A n=1 Tax=Gemmatirosa kalamazoonensis TaxID=861299 RepID=W0RIX7_9BACT|nr:Asp-tRNA(Asn)/Glu-tRNA(Gln) amidotransferase subunit GatA [Gemmatirosa kalamazoonensis]AHG90716.1 Glutamyl-tRNA(Gln) amidotransferase subunit A [Gemmatirosa kalamazoonensis]